MENEINAPYLVDKCPHCMGDGHIPSVDFDTMETCEVKCEECRGSGEIYTNPYDVLEYELNKHELYED